jgi:hypothetical protein
VQIKIISVSLQHAFKLEDISFANLRDFISLSALEEASQTLIFLANFFFLISLAIEDPIKPHPTMVILLNIKKSYPTA